MSASETDTSARAAVSGVVDDLTYSFELAAHLAPRKVHVRSAGSADVIVSNGLRRRLPRLPRQAPRGRQRVTALIDSLDVTVEPARDGVAG